MIDLDPIYDEFASVIRSSPVGDKLSTIPAQSGTQPSIIRNRSNSPPPDYPYVTMDVIQIEDSDSWETAMYADPASGDYNVDTHTDVLLSFMFYGNESSTSSAIELAQELKGYFRLPSVREGLRTSLGASVGVISNVNSSPLLRSESYLEAADFTIEITVIDSLQLTSSGEGYYNRVDGTGTLTKPDGSSINATITATTS